MVTGYTPKLDELGEPTGYYGANKTQYPEAWAAYSKMATALHQQGKSNPLSFGEYLQGYQKWGEAKTTAFFNNIAGYGYGPSWERNALQSFMGSGSYTPTVKPQAEAIQDAATPAPYTPPTKTTFPTPAAPPPKKTTFPTPAAPPTTPTIPPTTTFPTPATPPSGTQPTGAYPGLEAWLEAEPTARFEQWRGNMEGTPAQKRYYQGRFNPIHGEYKGALAEKPLMKFGDFLGGIDPTKRYQNLPSWMRGYDPGRTGRKRWLNY